MMAAMMRSTRFIASSDLCSEAVELWSCRVCVCERVRVAAVG